MKEEDVILNEAHQQATDRLKAIGHKVDSMVTVTLIKTPDGKRIVSISQMANPDFNHQDSARELFCESASRLHAAAVEVARELRGLKQ